LTSLFRAAEPVPWSSGCLVRGGAAAPPFAAHAWVEAGGIMVGEDYPADYFRPLFKVP
jgi:hypothetical protein